MHNKISSVVVGHFPCENDLYARISSPIGRSTRTFAVCQERDKKVFFTKDTWRIEHASLRPEHEIYVKLRAAKVPHIPELIDAGDVEDPATLARGWDKDNTAGSNGSSLTRSLRVLQHYRFVLERI